MLEFVLVLVLVGCCERMEKGQEEKNSGGSPKMKKGETVKERKGEFIGRGKGMIAWCGGDRIVL